MVMMFWGELFWLVMEFYYYSYCLNPTEREFLFPPWEIWQYFKQFFSTSGIVLTSVYLYIPICTNK
jgi:hypothetical protein